MFIKKCPFCAEKIQAKAIKCKHCGEMLEKQKKKSVSGRTVFFAIIGTILIFFIPWLFEPIEMTEQSSSNNQQSKVKSNETQQATEQVLIEGAAVVVAQELTVPTDVKYSIINSDTYLDWKRSLDVRLNKKVSEDTLYNLALELKSQDSRSYESTFICYYLPDMEVGSGAWATTHFDPDLEVKILGLTIEQESILRLPRGDLSGDVIGSWLNEAPFVGSRITIYREENKLFMETKYYDESVGKKEIVEKSSEKGKAFERKEGSSVGEYYLIDEKGDLQFWDEEGYIFTAQKI